MKLSRPFALALSTTALGGAISTFSPMPAVFRCIKAATPITADQALAAGVFIVCATVAVLLGFLALGSLVDGDKAIRRIRKRPTTTRVVGASPGAS